MRSTKVNVLLAVTVTLVTLVGLESVFRGRALLMNRGALSPDFTPPPVPTDGSPASLGHLLQPAKNPRRVYELRPDIAVSYQQGSVETNLLGLRLPSPDRVDLEAVRLVGIGDSVMFGQGVNDDETYLAVLGKSMEQRIPERRWQVVNTAVPGYNTVMEVETLKEVGLSFTPQIVIIEFVGNDLGLPNFIRQPEPVTALDRSFLFDFFVQRISESRPADHRPPEQALEQQGMIAAPEEAGRPGEFLSSPKAVPEAYRDMVGWQAFESAMRELANLAIEHNFAVVWMVLVPGRPELQDRAIALAHELDFTVVLAFQDLYRDLAARGLDNYFGSPLSQGPQDGHPSALGHHIAAEAIEAVLVEGGRLGVVNRG